MRSKSKSWDGPRRQSNFKYTVLYHESKYQKNGGNSEFMVNVIIDKTKKDITILPNFDIKYEMEQDETH